MKKTAVSILIALAVCLLFSVNACADELDMYIDALKDAVPTELEAIEDDLIDGGIPSFEDLIEYIIYEIKRSLIYPQAQFSLLFAIVLISCMFKCMTKFLKNDGMAESFDLIGNICISVCFFSVSVKAMDVVDKFLGSVSDFAMALTPILCGVCITQGRVNEGTVLGVGMCVFVAVCQKFFCAFLIPLLKILYVFILCSGVCGDLPDVSGINAFFKKLFNISLGFVTTMFSAVISYQSIISAKTDILLSKSIKFSLGNIIPVIGNSLSEAMKTVSGSIQYLRSTIGGVGVGVVLFLLLSCVVMLLVDRLILSFTSGVAVLIGVKKQGKLLADISGLYASLSALALCSSLMLIFMLSVFSSTATML